MALVMPNAKRDVKRLLQNDVHYARSMSLQSDRLRKARKDAGYETGKDAAEAMGVPVSTYLQHESGHRGFPASRAQRYGRFFRVTPEWLLYGRESVDKLTALGPQLFVVGEVAAGVFKEVWKREASEYEAFMGRPDLAAPLSKRFGLVVSGESMNQIYPHGTILECVEYEGQEIPSGKRVIVQRTRSDGTLEATVKELVKAEDGVVWLVPRSTLPQYQAFRADQPESPDIVSVEIIGVVVASTIRE
jgi:SOS-response transcriptional repressor LexA